MDIFSSTSVRSNVRQNSEKVMHLSPSLSASMIVRSAMLASCSVEMFEPTIMCKTESNSSRLIFSSPSRSYILKAKRSLSSREFSFDSRFFLAGRKLARTRINWRKLMRSSKDSLSVKKACTMRSPSGLIASSGIRRKSSRPRVPLSPLSRLVNRLYSRSICEALTVYKRKEEKL